MNAIEEIYNYNDNIINVIKTVDNIWFKVIDICRIPDYKNNVMP